VARRWGSAATAALLLVALAAPGAAVAQKSDVGFSISAEGFPSFFRYDASAGDEIAGAVVLRSESDRPESVILRAVDVMTAGTGGLDYGAERPSGVGTWIDLEDERLTLPAGGTARVPFTVRVPAEATPGDHLAGLVALNRADERRARPEASGDGFNLRFLPRLAIATWFTVPGPRDPELTLGNVGFDVTPSGAAVTLLLRNTGTSLIERTTGRVKVLQGERLLVSRSIRLDAFVPNTEVTYRLPLRGAPARGEYRVVGTIEPHGAPPIAVDETVRFGEEAATELRDETGQEAKGGTSPWMWALLGVLAVVAGFFAVGYLRARRALKR
jgi:hypothetical protein